MKLIWYTAVSLDGYITDARGSSEWVSQEDERQFAKLVASVGALVVGRRTFDQYHHPNPFPKVQTYVATTNPALVSDDPAISYIMGGPMEIMRRLHADGFTRAVLSGGGQTNGAFAHKGLIDEAWISVYPRAFGTGTRLLGDYQGELRLSFSEGYAMPGGVVHSRYRVN